MLDERQPHRHIALPDQAIGEAQSLGTGNTTASFHRDRREAHTPVGGNGSATFATVPAREPLHIHPVLLGVPLQAHPHGAAGTKMLQLFALALGRFLTCSPRHGRLRFNTGKMPRLVRQR